MSRLKIDGMGQGSSFSPSKECGKEIPRKTFAPKKVIEAFSS